MTGTPAFSIVVPVYNLAAYLGAALESISRQSEANFEAIVVVDGATDGSRAIAENHAAKDARFRVISQQNRGLSVARNVGLCASSGRWIYYFDGDDIMAPTLLEQCARVARADSSSFVAFEAAVFGDLDSPLVPSLRYVRPFVDGPVDSGVFLWESIRQERLFVQACCYCMTRSLAESSRFIPGLLFEDNPYFFDILGRQSFRVSVLHEKLFHRRIRPNSIMTEQRGMRHHESLLRVVDELIKLSFASIPSRERDDAIAVVLRSALGNLCATSAKIGKHVSADVRLANTRATMRAAKRVGYSSIGLKRWLTAVVPEVYSLLPNA